MSDDPSRRPLEQEAVPRRATGKDGEHIPKGESHFWGLPPHFFWDSIGVYRVRHFPKATRRKSQKEKTPDEIVAQFTIVLAVIGSVGAVISILSLVVIRGQLGEMQSSSSQTDQIIAADTDLAKAAKAQARASDALAEISRNNIIASQRAWIGPTNASIEPLVEQQPIKLTYTYQNSGREPALVRNTSVITFFDKDQWNSFGQGGSVQFSENYKYSCIASDLVGSQVVYPTSGFTSYNAYVVSDKQGTPAFTVGKGIMEGSITVAHFGCITYKAGDKIRHSVFCYFYNSNTTPTTANLNICETGGYAD